eukprot:1322337-Alexandrium_andersonii.AAC.1
MSHPSPLPPSTSPDRCASKELGGGVARLLRLRIHCILCLLELLGRPFGPSVSQSLAPDHLP